MPAYRIQSHTRHKSAEVVAGYIREADKWTKSGLDGVGFLKLTADKFLSWDHGLPGLRATRIQDYRGSITKTKKPQP